MKSEKFSRNLIVSCAAILGPIGMGSADAQTTSVTVTNAVELQSAVAAANAAGGNRTILLQDGTYDLSDTLYVNAPNVTIAGASGNRQSAIIQGDAMSSTARVKTLIRAAASGFQFRDATLQKSGWHLIQIVGESNADSPILRNCILRDAYQQMVKVSNDPATPDVTGDNGLVENCIFEYTAGIGPQYYIGGVDAHGSKNWVIRNNTFRSIISPNTSVAEFAVHFWDESANNTVERNLIINCDRGIGYGMDARGNSAGIIRNNMIYHSAGNGSFADTGIALIESPNTQVYNNTVFMENSYPWAIEYRFPTTQNVLITNNLVNRAIISRDGASGAVMKNVVNAVASWFANPSIGDLHLTPAASATTVNAGQIVPGLGDDFDGQTRPQGSAIDIGADEILVNSVLQPPSNLRVIN